MTDQFRQDALIRQLQGALAGALSPQAYVPSWTGSGSNPAIGDGTLAGLYFQVGEIVIVSINVVAGSTTTFGSGTYNLSLPVPAVAGSRWALSALVTDAGTQHYAGTAIINGGSTFEVIAVGSNSTGPAPWTSTVPFTFGSTDRAVITGCYAAA